MIFSKSLMIEKTVNDSQEISETGRYNSFSNNFSVFGHHTDGYFV